MTTITDVPAERARARLVAATVAVAFFIQFLDGTIIATSLPQMAASFGTDVVSMSAGFTVYMLTAAAFMPLSGWLADRYGAKRVFLGSLLTFTLASLACGLADTLPAFLAARVLQGLGAALMTPVGRLKFGSTYDHIAKGRWGINIVTGHRAVEHEMFGWDRIDHDRRYDMAGELFDVLGHLWSDDDNYSYEGRLSRWKLKDGYITPKPLFGRPVLVTATGSDAGMDFAARHSDLVFVTSPGGAHIDSALETLPAHVAAVKGRAKARGREVKTIINPVIVSRDTEADTERYVRAIVEGKHAAGKATFGTRGYDSDAVAWKGREDARHKQGYGLGGNIEIVGTPEQVVEQLAALKRSGIDGVQLNFYDFAPDFDHFAETTLPLLKSAGLRL